VPNGTDFVRSAASDSPSNAPDLALVGELVSAAFEIDNTPPRIVGPAARADGSATVVTFAVTDDHSPIQRVEYSQDGLTWRGAFPADGIADGLSERYDVRIDGGLGPAGLSIRAGDTMNNWASAQVEGPAGP
jgi:hypothetical protein